MSKIRIEVSARHCHLSQSDLDKLFGVGYKLKPLKSISQKGQFAAQETIAIKTKGGQLDNVRIVGPVRDQTQIELTLTVARKLKIKPPLKISGDLEGSIGAMLIGPKGQVKIKSGIIVTHRHLHCNPAQAKKLGLKNNQLVSVKTAGERSVTFHNVVVRIRDDFDLSVHLDTDEGNAAMPDGVCGFGELITKK
ncbi:phosphate propanoyltransferase [Candidatus Falkowbacteria bacterium]|uniref:Phosphate propanoyltransferase n=1 Tax=Candidatus Buchananbacteria bacterium CG10_big_fil_rev_8_21_14_0_10_33_19 TaxID=1974525 RepID=A0A2H0W3V6_9BACT|nr:phosphate propanoyltransferase [Candidatus Falkowbacteria bacterium]PIS06036.1 MAG: propanediol utilization protein [Candidatus Buchananbacteria bacterium CG10_big_fil_rev_8_21_14_0_10_33_19]